MCIIQTRYSFKYRNLYQQLVIQLVAIVFLFCKYIVMIDMSALHFLMESTMIKILLCLELHAWCMWIIDVFRWHTCQSQKETHIIDDKSEKT